jgi:SAM-dependent methyltransferase
VLRPLLAVLAGAPGPELLDVGGGTGNYARALRERGWAPTVLDPNPEMLERAAAKGLRVARGEATALPFADASFDAAMLVSMLHHVPAWPDALAEAARVVRPRGRVAVMLWTREHIEEVTWLTEYFPSTVAWLDELHPAQSELLAAMPGATEVIPFEFADLDDASIGALQRRPERVLDPEPRRQTSYFEQLGDRDPDGLRAGLARLADDLAAGRRPDEERAAARARLGDAAVIAWTPSTT